MAEPRLASPKPPPAQSCARCGTPIACNPGPDCWCAKLPPRAMPAAGAACLCRACLERDDTSA